MEIVNGSIVMKAVGIRYTVADFSFDNIEHGVNFIGFFVQYLYEMMHHLVPVHAEVDPIALAELDEYNATIIVKVPDVDWVSLFWPTMVRLSEAMSDAVASQDMGLVAWATYMEMGARP